MFQKMSNSVLVILVPLVSLASSLICPGCSVSRSQINSFNDQGVTDFGLSQSQDIAELMDCVILCSRDIRCRSYRHNALTKTCSTYGTGFSLPENTLTALTAEHGSRLYTMCGTSNSFGSSCSSNTDCNFANAVCFHGGCSCQMGSSYNVWTGDCLGRCVAYGNWMGGYPDGGVYGCNIVVVTVATPQRCVEACLEENSITCVNAEYEISTGTCNLCDVTWEDLEPSEHLYIEGSGWILFYRHCGY